MPKHIALAYIDMLTCLFAIFIALFFLSSEEVSKGNIKDVSQFIAEIDWSKDSNSDVDIWMKAPDGSVTSFRQTSHNNSISLDVDDLALAKVDIIRREVISVKTILPGHYIVNAMLYTKRDRDPVEVTGRLTKLQPFNIFYEEKFVLSRTSEEKTIVEFDVDPNGNVVNIQHGTHVSLLLEG